VTVYEDSQLTVSLEIEIFESMIDFNDTYNKCDFFGQGLIFYI